MENVEESKFHIIPRAEEISFGGIFLVKYLFFNKAQN